MNRYLVCAIVGTLTFASSVPASAQDTDWTGFYLGVSAGYNATDSSSEYVDPALSAYTIPSSQRGAFGGLTVGANYQNGTMVLGVEATALLGDISATFANPLGIDDDVTVGSDFQALLLGRVGVTVGNVLPYLTAGGAVAHAYSKTESGANDSGTFAGIAYGAGVEVALEDNWSLKAQYLHSNLTGDNFHVGQPWETHSELSSDTVMVGVNFRFD